MKATELKPKDLRIGNLINGYYENDCECYYGDCECDLSSAICEVLSLDTLGYSDYSIMVESKETRAEHFEKFLPIPLNEEWLVKLGFIKEKFVPKEAKKTVSYWHYQDFGMFYDSETNQMGMKFLDEKDTLIKSLHQLQNLYHALTGLELTIK